MKVLLLGVLLILSSISSFGQGKTKCEILEKIFKQRDAWILVKLRSSNLDTPIIFVDTTRFFKGCNIGKISGRRVEISHDSSLINQVNKTNIIVYIHKRKDGYLMDFYSKSTHANGVATLKEKNGVFFIIKSHFDILD